MGSVIRAGVTLVASAVVAVVAWIVARWMAGAEELAAWPILPAILASLAVLQGAAKLAVVVDWLFGRGGGDPTVALGGQFRTAVFAASLVPAAAYVVTFLVVFRRVKGKRL